MIDRILNGQFPLLYKMDRLSILLLTKIRIKTKSRLIFCNLTILNYHHVNWLKYASKTSISHY